MNMVVQLLPPSGVVWIRSFRVPPFGIKPSGPRVVSAFFIRNSIRFEKIVQLNVSSGVDHPDEAKTVVELVSRDSTHLSPF